MRRQHRDRNRRQPSVARQRITRTCIYCLSALERPRREARIAVRGLGALLAPLRLHPEPLATFVTARPRRDTAVAAAALGALSVALALQHASAAAPEQQHPQDAAGVVVERWGVGGSGSPLYPDLPPRAGVKGGMAAGDAHRVAGPHREPAATLGIPATVLKAYRKAAAELAERQSGCHLSVPLLAAIGRVESGHARGGDVDTHGTTRTPILGPQLAGGSGFAAISDTDGGAYDGDTVWDRAVGPMQFIPSTWQRWRSDGNSDGRTDPNNVFDASLAAGRYLCAAGGDVAVPGGLRRAILAYNHSESYLGLVVGWMKVYAGGAMAIPDAAGADASDGKTDRTKAGSSSASSRPGNDGRRTGQPSDDGRRTERSKPAPSPQPEDPGPGSPDDELPDVPSVPVPEPDPAIPERSFVV